MNSPMSMSCIEEIDEEMEIYNNPPGYYPLGYYHHPNMFDNYSSILGLLPGADIYLTSNPMVTYFRVIYRRHSIQYDDHNFENPLLQRETTKKKNKRSEYKITKKNNEMNKQKRINEKNRVNHIKKTREKNLKIQKKRM
jgi:hypothetical protein